MDAEYPIGTVRTDHQLGISFFKRSTSSIQRLRELKCFQQMLKLFRGYLCWVRPVGLADDRQQFGGRFDDRRFMGDGFPKQINTNPSQW